MEANNQLKQLSEQHRMLVAEMMKIKTPTESWEFKAMLKQLQALKIVIQAIQKTGYKPTWRERIESVLKRFKMRQIFTLFTSH